MHYLLPDLGIQFSHYSEVVSSNKNFILHDHRNSHELYFFLEGDADFLVEGTRYPLHRHDIVLAQSAEMHHVYHKSFGAYERIVINLNYNFFLKTNCEPYQEIFINRPLGLNNCIPAKAVEEHGIPDLLYRMERYLADPEDQGRAAMGALLELLYILNHIGIKKEKTTFQNEQIKDIILYINSHLQEPLPLDDIAAHFYITKCHLCRSFKKHTGYTINQYINHKRLQLAREYAGQGKTWTEASIEAGFGNYSNFYKLFCRTFGHSPRSH